jgi:hypothetical protein
VYLDVIYWSDSEDRKKLKGRECGRKGKRVKRLGRTINYMLDSIDI